MNNHPTYAEVRESLAGKEKTIWMGAHGKSKTPGVAVYATDEPQEQYRATYGFVEFAGRRLAYRVWSLPERNRHMQSAFGGDDFIGDLREYCKTQLLMADVLREDGQWVRV